MAAGPWAGRLAGCLAAAFDAFDAGFDAGDPLVAGFGARSCLPQGHFTICPAAVSGIESTLEQAGHLIFIRQGRWKRCDGVH